jgi:hypothetical protein
LGAVVEVGVGLVVGEVDGFGEGGGFGADALEFVEGAAVEALGLGLVAEEGGPGVLLVVLDHVAPHEALGAEEIAVLGGGDFEVAGESLGHEGHVVGVLNDLIEAAGEEAGFEAVGAEEGLLGEGEALKGEHFLGVPGLVEGEEVGAEVGDFMDFLEADDGEGGGGEAVLAGVLGRAGLAFGGAGAGGTLRVFAVGGELSFGHVGCILLFGIRRRPSAGRRAGAGHGPALQGLPRGGVGV